MKNSSYLQEILGTCRKNKIFSVHQNSETKQYHVYYGLELYDVVPNNKEDTRFKLMVAHLHIVGVTLSALQKAFELDPRTIKKWSRGLKSGDADKLQQALRGLGANRKLTAPIEQFVRMRFEQIYPHERYRYSRRIREDIKKVFKEDISSESLRKLFNELKSRFNQLRSIDDTQGEQENSEENENEPVGGVESESSKQSEEKVESANNCEDTVDNISAKRVFASNNRKEDTNFLGTAHCSHPGLLFFSEPLCSLQESLSEATALPVIQWISQVLLGAVNLEQSKLLSMGDLEMILGRRLLGCPQEQRKNLRELACAGEVCRKVLRWNFERVGGAQHNALYFDPHTKHYTGKQNVLKGWCSKIRWADKIINGDFVHTRSGQPIYLENTDNYEDIRKRFIELEGRFRSCFEIAQERVLTWIIDRGIFSNEIFNWVVDSPNKHLITWEKGYQHDGWSEGVSRDGSMIMERARNNSKDLRSYHFEWVEGAWPKNTKIRRFIVRATNPEKNLIEASILCDNWDGDAQSIIWSMFDRWVQENDFKYLNVHFGIDQITSYQSEPYSELTDELEDRSMKNSAYLALQLGRQGEKKRLGELLVKQKKARRDVEKRSYQISQWVGLNPLNAEQQKKLRALKAGQHSAQRHIKLREIKIAQSQEELDAYDEQLENTIKEVSRLETLIDKGMVRLCTDKKYLMDIIKITARNLFYELLEPFKKSYDNYRDDHVWFRHLTQTTTGILDAGKQVRCHLISSADYPKAVRIVIEYIIALFNQSARQMPDGSGRPIELILASKSAIKLAI